MIIYNSHYPHLIFVFMFPHLFNTSNFLCSNGGRYTIFTTVCKSVFVCTGTVRNFVPEQQLVTSPACSLKVCVNVFVLMYIIRGFLLVIAIIFIKLCLGTVIILKIVVIMLLKVEQWENIWFIMYVLVGQFTSLQSACLLWCLFSDANKVFVNHNIYRYLLKINVCVCYVEQNNKCEC